MIDDLLAFFLGLVQLTVVRGQESPRCLAKVARSSGTLLRSADFEVSLSRFDMF